MEKKGATASLASSTDSTRVIDGRLWTREAIAALAAADVSALRRAFRLPGADINMYESDT